MESVVEKMELTLFDWPPLAFVRYWVTPEIARGAEMVHGLLLPLLCFTFWLCRPVLSGVVLVYSGCDPSS